MARRVKVMSRSSYSSSEARTRTWDCANLSGSSAARWHILYVPIYIYICNIVGVRKLLSLYNTDLGTASNLDLAPSVQFRKSPLQLRSITQHTQPSLSISEEFTHVTNWYITITSIEGERIPYLNPSAAKTKIRIQMRVQNEEKKERKKKARFFCFYTKTFTLGGGQ